ncbi:MAG: hypothetical protein WCX28_04660 [Bacteriovoracaceae bacterium]|nr:hypothetical protein [Bacteroidota bacterium]
MNAEQLNDVFREIILGTGVKRSKHELIYEGQDVTSSFIDMLPHHNFHPTMVGQAPVKPGERIPAFYISQQTAYFGWVFWEKFSQLRLRKLFGTVVRNAKGDWLYQLPSNSTTIIYADLAHILEMDIDRPFEL